ncbi:MAG: outer membrane lipoprotein-sorting protein, partial [Proteobacteria bacterium]|nr:outer membrane lipoprotein-sorting protein [Pseudomonadota bacterium]
NHYTYTLLGRETLDTHPRDCHVIEAVPMVGTKESSGYSRRVMWVDQQYFFTLKIEFYDKKNRLLKTQKSFEWENIAGPVYRPRKIIMDHHRKKHKTLALVKTRELNKPIDDQVFTERFVLSEKHF